MHPSFDHVFKHDLRGTQLRLYEIPYVDFGSDFAQEKLAGRVHEHHGGEALSESTHKVPLFLLLNSKLTSYVTEREQQAGGDHLGLHWVSYEQLLLVLCPPQNNQPLHSE